MFPIRDHNPSRKTPFVTYALIAMNVLVFVATWGIGNDSRALYELYANYALVPDFVTSGVNLKSFVTSMFLHAGIMHIAGNMLFLWIFGDNMEEALGHLGFALFYLVSGIGAALFQVLPDPSSQVPMVGASGAIAGVMGGYLLLFPKAKVDILLWIIIFIRIFTVPAWVMLGVWFLMQVVMSTNASGGGGVAYGAHMGGFIVGFLWVLPLWLRRGGPAYWSRHHGHPPHPETRYRLSASNVPRAGRRR